MKIDIEIFEVIDITFLTRTPPTMSVLSLVLWPPPTTF